eukprot:Tbor_TRINITY_DN3087_c0_g1::TRINITY_DN3087_c0_g1_i1::g.17431::m.17431
MSQYCGHVEHQDIQETQQKEVRLLPYDARSNMKELTRKTFSAMARSALYAALARLLFGLSRSLLKSGLSMKFFKYLKREGTSLDPVRWAVFCAGLSSFRLIQQLLIRLKLPTGMTSFLGGFIASLPLMTMNINTRRDLGLYLGVRSIHGLICANWNFMPKCMRNFQHMDIAMMCLSAIEIIYCFLFHPHLHNPSYEAFFVKNSMMHKDAVKVIAGYLKQKEVPQIDIINRDIGRTLSQPVNIQDMREICLYTHPRTPSCPNNYIQFLVKHIATKSIPLYLPLKTISTLVFSWKKIRADPVKIAKKVLISSLQSSLFLTLYASVPIGAVCCTSQFQYRNTPLLITIVGILSGICTFLEPKSRRLDLALYCSMHAVNSFGNLLALWGYIPKPTRWWVFWLHSTAIAMIFHQFDHSTDTIHPNIISLVSKILKEDVYSEPKCNMITPPEGLPQSLVNDSR